MWPLSPSPPTPFWGGGKILGSEEGLHSLRGQREGYIPFAPREGALHSLLPPGRGRDEDKLRAHHRQDDSHATFPTHCW
jgi:hypothetical protein